MQNIVLRKENGKTYKLTREVLCSNKPYISEEDCFPKILNNSKIEETKKSEIVKVKKAIYTMFRELVKVNDINIIDSSMEILKTASKRKELNGIVNDIIDEFILLTKKRNSNKSYDSSIITVKSSLKTNPDLVISITIKKIVSTYFRDILENLSDSKIENLEKLKRNNVTMDEILKDLNQVFTLKSKRNGIYNLSKKVLSDEIDMTYDRIQNHLCWQNCRKASIASCPKVADRRKKPINKYEFIKDGYQVIDENMHLNKFIVTNCVYYDEDVRDLPDIKFKY